MRINGVKLLALCLVFLLFGVETSVAQGRKPDAGEKLSYFRGVVIDDEDEPLPGVTVMVVGKKGSGMWHMVPPQMLMANLPSVLRIRPPVHSASLISA